MTIQRYDPDHDYGSCWMEESGCGEYVTYDDYQVLEDDMSDLQLKYDNLVKSLGELYGDA